MAASTFATVLIVIVCRARGLPLRETLGLSWPPWQQVAVWLSLFILLVFLSELAHRALKLDAGTVWTFSPWVMSLRAAGIVVFAPVAEELIFRGMLYSAVLESRAGVVGAILFPALLFAVFHIQYRLPKMLLVLVDGLFFGLVRFATGSVLLPIAFHSLGNLYAVLQRLPATADLPLVGTAGSRVER